MTSIGSLKSKNNRTYVYLNPNIYTGPSAWRLSNIPGINDRDIDDTIQNLYTIAPISHTENGNSVELKFDISAIDKDVFDPGRASYSTYQAVNNLINYAEFKNKNSLFDLQAIVGVEPVEARVANSDAVVWFNLLDLENIDNVRSDRRMKLTFRLPYNSRSVNALTAVAPLYSETTLGQATVSFDIKSLPEA